MKKMYMYHFAIWILKNVFQIDLENFADKTYSEFDKVEKELVDLKKQNDLLKRELESIKEKTDKNIQQEIDDLLHKVKTFQERVDSIDPRISVDDEDLDNAFTDKYGVKYSREGKRLLKASDKLDYEDYKVHEGVVVICNGAFQNIDLKSIILPTSIVKIGMEAFKYCGELKSINIPNGVTKINSDTFRGCWSLTTIDIPESVEAIGGNAFSGCSNLVSIIIPESVKEIGWEAFKDCTSLSSVKIPQSIKWVNYGAFNNTPWYNNQPDGILYIGKTVYKYKGNMPNDTVIKIKEGTKTISPGAFYGCRGLVSIVIPDSVEFVGWRAFQYCNSLTSVIIGDGVKAIGIEAFANCTSLTSIEIPESVSEIGWAFKDCTNLSSIKIPQSINWVPDRTFDNTAWYNNQPDGLVYVGKVAYKYKGTMPQGTKIIIKEGTCAISPFAFSGYSNLTTIVIPDSVTGIGVNAFQSCSGLTSIIIPKGSREKFEKKIPEYKDKLVEK